MSRDELGIIRTHLANERTFLAYIRTSLAFLATGAGMIHFLHSFVLRFAGGFILAAGVTISVIGIVRFIAVKRGIAKSNK